jgi:uncharacterized protein (TIGR01777 family)
MKTVLISGGRGLIGKSLSRLLIQKGYTVYKLTRSPKKSHHIYWNPEKRTVERKHLKEIDIIINLAGSNISKKKWSSNRKQDLINSRINSIDFLKSLAKSMPKLDYFISASGINCYGYNGPHEKTEKDPFGDHFLSQLVKDWEIASDGFEDTCTVAKLRIAMVIDKRGGALKKIMSAIKFGLGSPLGSGKQYVPWVHIDDLCNMFLYCIENNISGTYNAANGYISNKEFMKTVSKKMKKPFFLPRVPKTILSVFLGEMSSILTESLKVSNEKIIKSGFRFRYSNFDAAISEVIKK